MVSVVVPTASFPPHISGVIRPGPSLPTGGPKTVTVKPNINVRSPLSVMPSLPTAQINVPQPTTGPTCTDSCAPVAIPPIPGKNSTYPIAEPGGGNIVNGCGCSGDDVMNFLRSVPTGAWIALVAIILVTRR